MDHFAFASLAQIKILLVPVGSITKSFFEKRAAEIRSFDSIPLGDITVGDKDQRARLLPTTNTLATGYLHLSFPSHPPPESHLPLSLLRPSAFPLGVIGITSCSAETFEHTPTYFDGAVRDVISSEHVLPVSRVCFAFEEASDGAELNTSLLGVEVIPKMDTKQTKLHLGTLLASLCSRILIDLSDFVQNLESPIGNEYLNSGLFATLPPSQLPSALDPEQRSESPPSSHSQPELPTISNLRKSSTLKRTSSPGPTLPSLRQPTLSASASGKKRASGIGAASSHGRLFKVFGDSFLLAGRTEDAVVWYAEALAMFKGLPDPLWHASVLEGLATVPILEAWASGTGLDPWIDPAEKITQASSMYSKIIPGHDQDQQYPFLTYLYITCVLRHASLLYSVWSAKGWGPVAFTTLLNPGPTPHIPPTLIHPDQLSFVNLERLSINSGIKRSQISEVLSQAHGPWLLHLGSRERIAILQFIAATYGYLGYRRKEAYILRETIGCVMDLVVCGREHYDDYRLSSAKPVVIGQDALTPATGTLGVRESEPTEGNEGVVKLVKYVCKIHGVDLEAVNVVETGPEAIRPRHSWTRDEKLPEDDLPKEPIGWPELQIGIVREAIAVAEALPDYAAVAQFCLSALKNLHPVMTSTDQNQLYAGATRALTTTKRRGDSRTVEYWTGTPIVTIELTPLPFVRLPVEKSISLLQESDRSIGKTLAVTTDPFLYNPRRSLNSKGNLLVVQNENLEFQVTLRNPFVFDLELSSLSLSTSGVTFESKPIPVLVPANSFHPVLITGRALEAGNLVVRGCFVQAPNGLSREFGLPLSTEEEEDKLMKRKTAIACEYGRTKYSGLAAHPWERPTEKRASIIAPSSKKPAKPIRYMDFKVVPGLPLLRIRRTSLTHSAVMLYNGERSTIRITLENVSSLLIDYLNLTFDDSTMGPAQQALLEGELSVFDTYETEYDLIHRQVLTWDAENDKVEIPPGKMMTVTVSCFGKAGCTNGSIHISYAYSRQALGTDPPADNFYTRQLTYPVLVTVYHMLECYDMDILSHSGLNDRVGVGLPDASLEESEGYNWCLFSIEVRNTYGLPFEVTFERMDKGCAKSLPDSVVASTCRTVPPGSTSRIILPLRKLLLKEEHASRPIPSLSGRQFVVGKSKLSSEDVRLQRELFWYREELLKTIRGRWKEAGGSRSGDLSLRHQRLTKPMLHALRTDPIHVQMELLQQGDDEESRKIVNRRGGKFRAPPNEFLFLRIRIRNVSPADFISTASVFFEPEKHVIYQGILQGIPLGEVQNGETRELEMAICFVSCGSFELRAQVEILNAPRGEPAGSGHATVLVEDE
ncbi:hypothetical protein BDM02DRAFT_3153426 [Thelephora ganbajun]|uniref:Uncharacterized protein n=1 Tax=Thelephora ganbajun TaxID=370292 RepID=A0ACB6ZT80_THEGA|nr:hypothetical protein BDM02DRAFT_3153426 [Thelephora ganbajun]